MPYDIYVLGESSLTLSSGQLDGVTQGDGSHLNGVTITLNSNAWTAISINDDDANFQDSDGSQTLNGAQDVDGTTYASGSVVEAEYGITVSYGGQSWQLVAFNVNNSSPAYGTVEGLAFIGGPGGFPPIGVPLLVTSTQEGPNYLATEYATPICFADGTLIETSEGIRPVEQIEPGDLVLTSDNGAQPVRWRYSRSFPALGDLAPIVFEAGAIGNRRRLILSPQHRIKISDWRAQLWFGEDAVLVPAKFFVDDLTVRRVEGGMVTYNHLMFDDHQMVFAEGVEAESFFPGAEDFGLDADATRRELLDLFPELSEIGAEYGPLAHRDVRGREAHVLMSL